MTKLQHIEGVLKQRKEELRHRFKLQKMGIFGSYLKGEQHKKSDLDILVEFIETPGLLEFIELEQYLSKATKLKVDLVMKGALKPELKKYILKEVIYI